MWLIFANENDDTAQWARRGLTMRGFSPVQLMDASALMSSVRWEHRLGRGGVRLSLQVEGGSRIHSSEVAGVLNRLVWLPNLYPAQPSDREYAAQELAAFFTSWLYSLPCPVLNRATAQGLCGTWYSSVEWACMADRAGLLTLPYRQSTYGDDTPLLPPMPAHTVFVIGQQVIAPDVWPVPRFIRRGCQRLSTLAYMPMVGVDFDSDWTFLGATPLPDLHRGGDAVLDAVAEVFQGG